MSRGHFAREVSMQFLEDITHPPAVGAAIETPAEAANRRGAHWVALPDDHDLLAPLARLVSARDGHHVVPFHIVVGLMSRVLRLPAVVDGALAAVSTIALGSPSLEYMETILGHVKAEPYSLSFDGLDAVSLLRAFKHLSAHDRLSVDPRFVVSLANVLQFEPLILHTPAAGAAAGGMNVPLTAEQRLGNEFMDLPWPVSENALLSPFADVVLSLGQLVLSAHKLDPAGQAQRLSNRLCYFMRTHDPMAGGMPADELAPLALDFFVHSELPVEFTSDILVTGKHGAISELSDRARFASDQTRSQVFRERFPRLVSSLPIMAKLMEGSAPLDKWTLSQRLVERTGHSSGSSEVSTYIELENELSNIEDAIPKDGEAHERVQSLLLFLDDRARRRVAAPAGSSSSSSGSAAVGVSSYSNGSELAELLASPNVMGPNGLAERLRLASDHVDTDDKGVATRKPADFIKLLAVAIDSRLAPLYRHALHKQTQDSHEIFTLTGPAISQLDKYFAYMLSVHNDGGERGPHLSDVFSAFSPELKSKVQEKVKSFRVDATFVTDFKKGDWIKTAKRDSIIVRLFHLFGDWLVHFNKLRPTPANTVYDVLVHAHFDNFRLFAGRAFNAIAFPRLCLPPTPGIEHVLSVAAAGASLGSQVASMRQSSTEFVGDLIEYASEEFKRYLVATSPLTMFPPLFVSGHNAFELFQTAQMRAMELVELANTNPQLRAVLLSVAAVDADGNVQVVPAPTPPTPPLVHVDASPADDNKRKAPPAPPAGTPTKKGDKVKKGDKTKNGDKPDSGDFHGKPGSWKHTYMGLTPDKRVPGCCGHIPKIVGDTVTVLWASNETSASIKKMAGHIGCAPTENARCWGCVMSTHPTPACVVSLCKYPLDKNHIGPNAPMHQKPSTFNAALFNGDFQ